MVSINYSAREVCCKIVYYGPGLSGKTTNLQYVHSKVPGNTRGELISLATEADRTLYFDFLPINIGSINGFAAKFQLYTVPGQVYYNATRKLVLRGVDGVCFVADSQPDKMDENIESLMNLEENLREYGYDMKTMPVVIQYNKRDLPGVLPVEDLQQRLNPNGWPAFEASATIGNGVFDTLKMIIKMVLEKAKSGQASSPAAPAQQPDPMEAAAPPPPASPPTPAPEPVAPPVAAQPQPSAPSPSPTVEPTTSLPDQLAPAAQATESAPVADSSATEGPSLDEPLFGNQEAASPAAAPVESNQEPAAVETATIQPTPAEASEPDYRPYPGSKTGKVPTTPPIEQSEPVNDTAMEAVAESPAPANIEEKDKIEDQGRPSMAPSLKKREAPPKKRGFFKRLFGIK